MSRRPTIFGTATMAGMGSFEALPLTPAQVRERRRAAPVPYPQLVFGVWGPYIAGYGWTANPLGFTAPMRRQGYA